MDEAQSRKVFVAKLLAKTNTRALAWKENAEEDSYSATLGRKFAIRVTWAHGDGIDLLVSNPEDVELFRFREDEDAPPGEIFDIYKAAKNSALGLTEAMDEMLSELDRLM